ncbi:hypothetical protein, partial [Mycoplasmopsis cricetuli]|uniref:hypothetical protein n=1 Tax=Mycoplasmopsis cricetuli TaxID=171283 RepID=UPI0005669FF9
LKGGRKYTFKELRIKNSDDTGERIWIDNSPNNESNNALKTLFFNTQLSSNIEVKKTGSRYEYYFVKEESGIINIVGSFIVNDEDDIISVQDLDGLEIRWMPNIQRLKNNQRDLSKHSIINKASGANFRIEINPQNNKEKIIKFNFDGSKINLLPSAFNERIINNLVQPDLASVLRATFKNGFIQLNQTGEKDIFFVNWANISNINKFTLFAIKDNKFPELILTNNNSKKIATNLMFLSEIATLKQEDWFVAYFKDLRGNYKFKKFQFQADNSLDTNENQVGLFNVEIDNISENNNKYIFEGLFGANENTIDEIINKLQNSPDAFNPNDYKFRWYPAKNILKTPANPAVFEDPVKNNILESSNAVLSQNQREVQIDASNTSLTTTIDNITNNSARAKFVFNNTDEAFKYLNSDLNAQLKIQLGKVSDNSNFGVEQTIVLNNTNTVVTQ